MAAKTYTNRLVVRCAEYKTNHPDADAHSIANHIIIASNNEEMLGLVKENEAILDTDLQTLDCDFDCLADVIERCCLEFLAKLIK